MVGSLVTPLLLFTVEYASGRILKIGQYLMQLFVSNQTLGGFFLTTLLRIYLYYLFKLRRPTAGSSATDRLGIYPYYHKLWQIFGCMHKYCRIPV